MVVFTAMSVDSVKKIFNDKVKELNYASSHRSLFLDNECYNYILWEVKKAQILRKNNQPLTSKHYRRLIRYNVMKIGDMQKLTESGSGENEDSNIRYYCKVEELFDVLETAHVNIGHKRTRGERHCFVCDLQKHFFMSSFLNFCFFLSVMDAELKKKYCNVTRQVMDLYLALCEQCQLKEKTSKQGLVVHSVLSHYLNSQCQVDLIDMQAEPKGYYRFIMNYQDHLTKFTILRPLKSKTAEEVAYQLMDIFCMFGAPFILQSDNGREFANKIIQNFADMWPGMKLVHGKPRHSQSQGSFERSKQDVRDILLA